MSIRSVVFYSAVVVLLAAGAIAAVRGSARAKLEIFMACGAEYQTAKEADKLAGQSWRDFFEQCRARAGERANMAQNSTPAASRAAVLSGMPAASAVSPATAPKPANPAPSDGAEAAARTLPPLPEARSVALAPPATGDRAAERSRHKKCMAEWRSKKVELRTANPGLRWPQYWSECDERLKASAQ